MIRSKDNFLQVSDGAWIYFEDYGKDKGEPIMILHGFLCSSKFFYKILMPSPPITGWC